ncbi:hypothetical protein NPX13_g5181 [Xylaria arbuscula]|uniref:Frequency clock protein n=1 Tax=Xylaria arbuscula TaxID=114810 RepID=A0A9W8NF09_9PEZI|nr:hypothetical protein NPX13_g5181 [Xylaria arbuscula]
MADLKHTDEGMNAPPTPAVTYTNPRRIAPEKSITLRHHRLARDASRRHPPPTIPTARSSAAKPQMSMKRRNSSDESNETKWSDPRLWFEESNQNAKSTLETSEMDVDPPFFQKETDSSNEEFNNKVPSLPSYAQTQGRGPTFRPSVAKSSSADDYRSVIDDLTIENKRLKEELRKFKQMGPNSLRNDKLFEVKVHGLPSKKKRELEATLRDFTTKLERSSTSTSRKRASGKSKEGNSSGSKHASSTSGSNSRPVDSAYASMETGPSSSSNTQPGQTRAARLRSNQNIQQYLRDIPEGLWPKPTMLTDHDKKKLVVKRLEHLFTGKMGHAKDNSPPSIPPPPALTEDVEMEDTGAKVLPAKQAAREAMIRSKDSRKKTSQKASHSSTGASASNTRTQSQSQSNADQSNSRDNDKDSGSGSGRSANNGKNTSPQGSDEPLEQRPTRPRDLDPDRRQVPADNMEYIRHLGIVAPESEPYFSARDVSPDAEGWVYLNLLANLAQLHILNVTPDFIRSAVSEKSTKFQLSPDGRKIRWRGGDEGTRFTSDSGSKSQTDRSGDESDDGSNEQNQPKKQKGTKFGLGVQNSNSSQDFHYKPLFVHRPPSLPRGQSSSTDDSGSSNGQSEASNGGMHSKWNQSGVSPEQSQQRKRRRDGAIIYYSGAPFCTDLSGDYGEVSADTYDMTSSDDQHDQPVQAQEDPVHLHLVHRPYVNRSPSGSSIQIKPLSEPMLYSAAADEAESTPSEADSGIEADFPWSDADQESRLVNLEASGLGGTYPDDHFYVVVSTRRPKTLTLYEGEDVSDDEASSDDDSVSRQNQSRSDNRLSHDSTTSRGTADSIASRMASMSTASSLARDTARRILKIKIEYGPNKVNRLPPVPLPPPCFYFRWGESEDTEEYGASFEDDRSVSSERSVLSKRPMLEGSPGSDNRDLSGNDEEDDYSDSSPGLDRDC